MVAGRPIPSFNFNFVIARRKYHLSHAPRHFSGRNCRVSKRNRRLSGGKAHIAGRNCPMSAWTLHFPARTAAVPTGFALAPAGNRTNFKGSRPDAGSQTMTFAGKMTIPAGKMTFPAGSFPNSFGMNSLRFCRGCGRRRIGIIMPAHLAADGVAAFGLPSCSCPANPSWRQSCRWRRCKSHRRRLATGTSVLLLHVQVFLLGGQVADGFNFALQPRNVRGRCRNFSPRAPFDCQRSACKRRPR